MKVDPKTVEGWLGDLVTLSIPTRARLLAAMISNLDEVDTDEGTLSDEVVEVYYNGKTAASWYDLYMSSRAESKYFNGFSAEYWHKQYEALMKNALAETAPGQTASYWQAEYDKLRLRMDAELNRKRDLVKHWTIRYNVAQGLIDEMRALVK